MNKILLLAASVFIALAGVAISMTRGGPPSDAVAELAVAGPDASRSASAVAVSGAAFADAGVAQLEATRISPMVEVPGSRPPGVANSGLREIGVESTAARGPSPAPASQVLDDPFITVTDPVTRRPIRELRSVYQARRSPPPKPPTAEPEETAGRGPSEKAAASPPEEERPLDVPETPKSASPFQFFNALLFNPMPIEVERMPEFPRLRVVYGTEIWNGSDAEEPPEPSLRRIANSVDAGEMICLDIEHWPMELDNPEELARNLNRFLRIVNIIKDENPSVKLGFYGLMSDLRPDVSRLPYDHPKYVKQRFRNDAVMALTDAVDFLAPVLYTSNTYEQFDLWEITFRGRLQEARRVAKGKPVYPFIWFVYHSINVERGGERIEPEFWKKHIEFAIEEADGAIVWGGYTKTWKRSEPWWDVLRPFLVGMEDPVMGD